MMRRELGALIWLYDKRCVDRYGQYKTKMIKRKLDRLGFKHSFLTSNRNCIRIINDLNIKTDWTEVFLVSGYQLFFKDARDALLAKMAVS